MKNLRKRLLAIGLASMLALDTLTPVMAYTEGVAGSGSSGGSSSIVSVPSTPPSNTSSAPSEVEASTSDSENYIGNGCYCRCVPFDEVVTLFHPKVTLLHNVNSLIAQKDGKSVYYIPTLDDLPFNLGDTALSITEPNGKQHEFALVYDGMFDAEAAFSTAMSEKNATSSSNYAAFHTSKDLVNDSDTGSLAVNKIGTDILLTKEKFDVQKTGRQNTFTYTPYIAGTVDLNGMQVVMDLYKALGVFEYRVQYTFSQDEDWDSNSNPILQQLNVLTDKAGTDGFDISESRCDVSVTRTWPAYYWDRFLKDGVNAGTQLSDQSSLSNITHLDSALGKSTSVTLAQFVNCATALMNIYGEAAVSESELERVTKVYPTLMATLGELTETEQRSLQYLIIKGIVSEDEITLANWHSPVHLLSDGSTDGNSIITWLGRIANPESRLPMNEVREAPSLLADAGYSATDVVLTDSDVSELTVVSQEDANSYDLLVAYDTPVSGLSTPRSCYIGYNGEVGDAAYASGQYSNKPTSSVTAIDEDTEVINEILANNDTPEDTDEDLRSIGLMMATGDIYLSGLKRVKDTSVLTANNATNMYYYVGTETFDDQNYYHFKISKKITKNTALVVKVPGGNKNAKLYTGPRISSTNLSQLTISEKLSINGGGVIPLNATNATTFSDEGFDRTYIDANALEEYPMISMASANDQYIFSFYVKSQKKLEEALASSDSIKETGVSWNEMLQDNGKKQEKFRLNETVALTTKNKYRKAISVYCRIEQTTYTKDRIRKRELTKPCYFVQILTNDRETIENWSFLKSINSNRSFVDAEDNEAYVMTTSDGKVYTMLSCERLKAAGYITSYQEVSDDVFALTVGSYENNVIINRKYNFIIVGNTLILPQDRDSIILYTKDDDRGWLICLEACLGWAGSYSYIRDTANATIITNNNMYGLDAITQTNSVKSISAMFPRSMVKSMWTDYQLKNGTLGGFNMSSTYALAPYLIVMDMSSGSSKTREDWLFVWHRQDAVKSNGKAVKHSKKTDKFARELFSKLISTKDKTVTDLFESVDSNSYVLSAYHLDVPNDHANVNKIATTSTENYVRNFCYRQVKRKGRGKDATVTAGWIYNPPIYTDITEALDDYAASVNKGCYVTSSAKGVQSNQEDVRLAIPIFQDADGVFYDANVNFIGESEGDYLPVGTMVGKVVSSTASGDLLKLDTAGKYVKDTTHDSADGYEVFTAPVAQFASLKGLGSAKVSDIRAGSVYFGTSRCRMVKGKASFGDMSTELPNDTPAVVSYLSTGNSTVYVISTGTTMLSDVLESINTVLEYSLTDPDNLVNWTNYKLQRMVANADAWSTVALIFVLNILPRIVLLLFMVLMMLSLVKDWRPWQRLCRNVFDIYKLITLGHQTVDTIDTKRVFFVSLVCAILMVMILNGTLFEFIIFVAKFFVALYQH